MWRSPPLVLGAVQPAEVSKAQEAGRGEGGTEAGGPGGVAWFWVWLCFGGFCFWLVLEGAKTPVPN